MRFEKWQALGNDYLIVDARERGAPLSAEAVQRLCDRHTGVGADGLLELGEAGEPGYVARVRIVNPDGSEAELSGNGVRQAALYLRTRGWTDARRFSVLTAAGEIRPTILSDTTCSVDMGRARLRSPAPERSARASSSAAWGRRRRRARVPAARRSLTCCAAATRRSPCTWTAASWRSRSARTCTST